MPVKPNLSNQAAVYTINAVPGPILELGCLPTQRSLRSSM